MGKLLGAAIGIALVLGAADVHARDAGTPEDDVASLEKHLREEHAALQTQDCVLACRALASIRRAADRICALEPGPRCDDARAKADDARKRVSEACPDCALAAAPPTDDERRAAAKPAPAPAQERVETSGTESAPRRGGCASCTTTGAAPGGDLAVVLLGAWAASRVVRRRPSRRR